MACVIHRSPPETAEGLNERKILVTQGFASGLKMTKIQLTIQIVGFPWGTHLTKLQDYRWTYHSFR